MCGGIGPLHRSKKPASARAFSFFENGFGGNAMSVRHKWIVGNWKMNGSVETNAALIANLRAAGLGAGNARVAVCPPAVYLGHARTLLSQTPIALGAQDVSEAASGAFTGQLSAAMLREMGCELAIVGHSERRHGLGETDAIVAKKAKAALSAGLTPIVCVGETLAERDAGHATAVVQRQLSAVLQELGAKSAHILVAYEPVWAIGTGKTASPEDAQNIHASLRGGLQRADVAHVPILYGGSVKADNAAQLLAMTDIDGALVGGAALDAASFSAICAAAH
jgi:triosephosphate isomerase (TIM)